MQVSKLSQLSEFDVFDLAPTAFTLYWGDKVPLKQHGVFCALAETLGGFHELHSDDVEAYLEIMDIFSENPEEAKKWLPEKVLHKWGVSKEMPLRPAFQN